MATMSLISFCLLLLLGSPAGGQAATADRVAPQDLEIHTSIWHALGSGIVHTARLNEIIATGTMGRLDLPTIGRLLGAAQAELEALNARFRKTAHVVPGGGAAEARKFTVRERARSAPPAEKLLFANQEVDAPEHGMQLADGKLEEILRRALVAAKRDLDAMRRVAEKQRQRAETLSRDLTTVLQLVEELKVKAAGAMRSKAAALRARDAAEAALADGRHLAAAQRAAGAMRLKAAALSRRDAAEAALAATLEPDSNLAAAEKAAVVLARQTAEAAARRAVEELALEREKAKSLARDLDTARRERDASKRQLARILAAQRRASEDARDRAGGRDVAAARKEIDVPRTRTERRIEHALKPLPDELLPKRSAVNGP